MDFERMIPIVVLCLCLVSSYRVNGTRIVSKEKDLELERQLKLINKPPVKSIRTEFGHIVDCVDINKQLAFDHPLLKDHKIQRRPRFSHRTTKNVGPSQTRPSMIGLVKDACPSGTVPIRRTTKENLIAIRSFSNNIHPQTEVAPGVHRAVIQTSKNEAATYTGVKGNINVYNPEVKEGDSYAQIYVMKGPEDDSNSITTGWVVSPSLYSDPNTHFFTLWTTDGYKKTGCFNTNCPGFVQVSRRIYPGAILTNVSTSGGPQFEIAVSIDQLTDGNWWVSFGDELIGYFPATILFNNFNEPEIVGWGGVAVGPPNRMSPPMGSGLFPDGSYKQACSFRQVQYTDNTGNLNVPREFQYIIDNKSCYDLKNDGYHGEYMGYTFKFGGPGGECGN